jgi:hypothetical protein
MREKINTHRIFVGKTEGKTARVDVRIMVEMPVKGLGWNRKVWTGFIWLRIGTGNG